MASSEIVAEPWAADDGNAHAPPARKKYLPVESVPVASSISMRSVSSKSTWGNREGLAVLAIITMAAVRRYGASKSSWES